MSPGLRFHSIRSVAGGAAEIACNALAVKTLPQPPCEADVSTESRRRGSEAQAGTDKRAWCRRSICRCVHTLVFALLVVGVDVVIVGLKQSGVIVQFTAKLNSIQDHMRKSMKDLTECARTDLSVFGPESLCID